MQYLVTIHIMIPCILDNSEKMFSLMSLMLLTGIILKKHPRAANTLHLYSFSEKIEGYDVKCVIVSHAQ